MLVKAKVIKYSAYLILSLVIIGFIYYQTLNNRHKAIVKTKILHTFDLVDSEWDIHLKDSQTSYISPTLVIDDIYKSMEGPKALGNFQIDNTRSDLVWLTSFSTTAKNVEANKTLSNDFICHTNINYFDGEHYSKWGLDNRIGSQYPRLTSLSNGIEKYAFPEGFGFPMFTDESLFLATQTLNHNITDKTIKVKHDITLGYKAHSNTMKPLQSKTIYIMLPYDKEDPFKGPTEADPNVCLPVDAKNHSYLDEKGRSLSGHWVVFPGKMNFKYDVTKQLALKDSTTMHHIAVHLHPFSESLAFRDKTIDSTLFTSIVKNYTNKIGLTEVTYFSSEEGVMLYPDHDYELVLKTNNTSNQNQDMMASMFVFLYDKEMDALVNNYKPN